MLGLLGRKIGMTQIFSDNQEIIPISIIELIPSQVLEIKTIEKHGYDALVLGYQDIPKNKVNKPKEGFFSKNGVNPKKYIYEIRLKEKNDIEKYKLHDYIDLSIFQDQEKVDIKGKTKGKGFQGVIKMHKFSRGPMGHGSDHHRRLGSLGGKGIERVWKGRKLPRKMGNVFKTLQNLKVVELNVEKNLIYIRGAIPGANNSMIKIFKAIKNKKKKESIR